VCRSDGGPAANVIFSGNEVEALRELWAPCSRHATSSRQGGTACELRNDVRHFRTERVVSADVLHETFSIRKTVIAKWLAEHQDD
jgi:hypothetical protein